MPRNKISDLRNHLFETLEALKDQDNPMEVVRAKAVAEIAQVLVNTAKVEIDLAKAVGATPGDGFFNLPEEALELKRLDERALRALPAKEAAKA